MKQEYSVCDTSAWCAFYTLLIYSFRELFSKYLKTKVKNTTNLKNERFRENKWLFICAETDFILHLHL
jgi:hypothetical protein